MGERPGASCGDRGEEGGEGERVGPQPVAAHEAGEEREQGRRSGARRGGGAEEEVGEGGGRWDGGGGGEEEKRLGAGEVGGGGGEGKELGEEESFVREAIEEKLRVELVEAAADGEGGARAADSLCEEVEALLQRAGEGDVRRQAGREDGGSRHVSPRLLELLLAR